jgi:hypothetical protein
MNLQQVIFSLLILAGTFLTGINAIKLCVAREMNSYTSRVKENYFFNDKEKQAPFLRAYKVGQKQAQRDLEQGKIKLQVKGILIEDEQKLFANIDKKYAIELNRITDCIITAEIDGYWLGYNEVMELAIEELYGTGFLEKISS